MTTDTPPKRVLSALICTELTGHACDPRQSGNTRGEGKEWYGGNPEHFEREYCVDPDAALRIYAGHPTQDCRSPEPG